jgi:hypothetical protein
MQVIASASQPHATETASGSVNISFDIINAPILKSTYFLKNTVYNTTEIHGTQYLEKGQLVFSVTYNGTPYSGATVILSKSSIVSALNISSFSATTNSAGQAVFNFSVTSKDLSSAQLVGDLKNTTITAQIYSNSKKINNFTMQPSLSLARAAVTSSASSAYVDIIIGGIVGAVVVVGVASYVLFFRKKIKKQ